MGCGFKVLVFCRNNGWVMKNMDNRLTVLKWVLIVCRKNTPNAPEFICPNCLPKTKSSGFQWKKTSLGVRSPWSHRPLCTVIKSRHFCSLFTFYKQCKQKKILVKGRLNLKRHFPKFKKKMTKNQMTLNRQNLESNFKFTFFKGS